MLHRFVYCLLLPIAFLTLLGCSRGPSTLAKPRYEDNLQLEDPKTVPIRECYAKFKSALLAHDSQALLKITDSSTLPWFEKAIEGARTMKRDELSKLNMWTRLYTLYVRQKYLLADLKEMDATKGLAVYVKDWSTNVQEVELATVRFEKDETAVATLVMQPTQDMMAFKKVDGEWKVNFAASMDRHGESLASLARSQNKSEDDILIEAIASYTKATVNRKILDGPLEEK